MVYLLSNVLHNNRTCAPSLPPTRARTLEATRGVRGGVDTKDTNTKNEDEDEQGNGKHAHDTVHSTNPLTLTIPIHTHNLLLQSHWRSSAITKVKCQPKDPKVISSRNQPFRFQFRVLAREGLGSFSVLCPHQIHPAPLLSPRTDVELLV